MNEENRNCKEGKIFLQDYNSWIAIVFLICIFVLPMLTIFGVEGKEAIRADVNAVLTANGTAAESGKTDMDEEQLCISGNDTGQNEGLEEKEADWTFSMTQETLNDFTKRLFLRNEFILLNSKLTQKISGGTYMESTQVLLGKEDWLFYKTQNDGFPIYDYMGINHFTDLELEAMASNLILTRDYFEKEKGIRFVAVTIPNKEIVYEEYMPDTIARVNTVSRGEQFASYMHANTDVPYVYPKNAFLVQKEKYPLFYKTDTHWNHIGAFVGVQEIFGEIYGEKTSPESVFFAETQKDFAGDLSVIAGVSEQYGIDTVYEFDPASVDASEKKDETLIVVGDSFGGFLSVIAGGYYENVYWVRTDEFTISMADEYGADIVIWETVERLQETYMQNSLLD